MSNDATILCISRINSLYNTFTATEKRIADYILSNYDQVPHLTVAQFSEITDSSAGSIIRFCKKIGFTSYVEMKLSLSKQWLDLSDETAALKKKDSIAIIKQKVLKFNEEVIKGMNHTLNEVNLERAADMLCKARNIVIIGDGGSSVSARNAYDVFLQLRLQCDLVSDPFFQILKIDQMKTTDVLLAVSNSGRSKNTLENLKQAHDNGIQTIGIIGIPNSPMSKYLDVEIHTNIFNSQSFCDSVAAQICELSAIAVLHGVISMRRSRNTNNNLSSTYDKKRVRFDD